MNGDLLKRKETIKKKINYNSTRNEREAQKRPVYKWKEIYINRKRLSKKKSTTALSHQTRATQETCIQMKTDLYTHEKRPKNKWKETYTNKKKPTYMGGDCQDKDSTTTLTHQTRATQETGIQMKRDLRINEKRPTQIKRNLQTWKEIVGTKIPWLHLRIKREPQKRPVSRCESQRKETCIQIKRDLYTNEKRPVYK